MSLLFGFGAQKRGSGFALVGCFPMSYIDVAEFDPLTKESAIKAEANTDGKAQIKPLLCEFWQKVQSLREILKGFWGLHVEGDEEKSTVGLKFFVTAYRKWNEADAEIIKEGEKSARDVMLKKLSALGLLISPLTDTAEWENVHLQIKFNYIAQDVAIAGAGHSIYNAKGYCIATDTSDRLGY
jgi:hypothetical protein